MAEGGFERMDNVEERRSQDDEIFTRKMFNMMHISRDSKKGNMVFINDSTSLW